MATSVFKIVLLSISPGVHVLQKLFVSLTLECIFYHFLQLEVFVLFPVILEWSVCAVECECF